MNRTATRPRCRLTRSAQTFRHARAMSSSIAIIVSLACYCASCSDDIGPSPFHPRFAVVDTPNSACRAGSTGSTAHRIQPVTAKNTKITGKNGPAGVALKRRRDDQAPRRPDGSITHQRLVQPRCTSAGAPKRIAVGEWCTSTSWRSGEHQHHHWCVARRQRANRVPTISARVGCEKFFEKFLIFSLPWAADAPSLKETRGFRLRRRQEAAVRRTR